MSFGTIRDLTTGVVNQVSGTVNKWRNSGDRPQKTGHKSEEKLTDFTPIEGKHISYIETPGPYEKLCEETKKLEEELSKITTELKSLDENISAQEKEKVKLNTHQTLINGKIAAYYEELAKLFKSPDAKATEPPQNSEIIQLTGELTTISKKLTVISQAVENMRKQKSSLEEKAVFFISDLQKKIELKEEMIKKLQNDNASSREVIQKAQQRIASTTKKGGTP